MSRWRISAANRWRALTSHRNNGGSLKGCKVRKPGNNELFYTIPFEETKNPCTYNGHPHFVRTHLNQQSIFTQLKRSYSLIHSLQWSSMGERE